MPNPLVPDRQRPRLVQACHSSASAACLLRRAPLGEWRSLGNPCVGGSELDMATTFFSQARRHRRAPARPPVPAFLTLHLPLP